MSKNTGGPAFPTTKPLNSWGDPNQGMTLRDYFAGLAMQGYISYMGCEAEATDHLGGTNKEVIARNAYAFADAMLAEREKGDE